MPFQRPTLPYANINLPNSNRYTVLSDSATPRPPSAEMVDGDINYLIDTANALEVQIGEVVAGNIPGSDDPNNANLLLTTDGGGNLSWIQVGQNQYENASITSVAIANSAVNTNNIVPGCINNVLLSPQCVQQVNLDIASVGTNQLQNACITATKMGDNSVLSNSIAERSVYFSKTNTIYGLIAIPSMAILVNNNGFISSAIYNNVGDYDIVIDNPGNINVAIGSIYSQSANVFMRLVSGIGQTFRIGSFSQDGVTRQDPSVFSFTCYFVQ